MFKYSATKRIANPPLPYSMLNPETNSDSPSAKSKGARLVSASAVANHIKTVGKRININQICGRDERENKDKEVPRVKGIRRMRAMDTS